MTEIEAIKHATLAPIEDDRNLVIILRNCLFEMFERFHDYLLIGADRRW